MRLHFSKGEIAVIKLWAERSINGGHWGNSDFALPEEAIILEKLESAGDGYVDLTHEEASIILTWSECTLGITIMEEENALAKVKSAADRNVR